MNLGNMYISFYKRSGETQWVRDLIPGVGMGLCVGEVGRPRWLALTEGTVSWSMPTGLKLMSFILG